MKLALLILCYCAAALAAGPEQDAVAELSKGISYLFRRYKQFAAPDQVYLEDALNVRWRYNSLMSLPHHSTDTVTFQGDEYKAFSSVQRIISPEQRSHDNLGSWYKNDGSEVTISHNYGGSVRVHMLTESGVLKAVDLGNPLKHKGAQFTVFIPRGFYFNVESTSIKNFSYLTYVAAPEYKPENVDIFTVDQMAAQFPEHGELFRTIATYDVTKEEHRDQDHDDDHDNHHDHSGQDDHDHGRHGHSSHRRH